jgi:hypothetical protein
VTSCIHWNNLVFQQLLTHFSNFTMYIETPDCERCRHTLWKFLLVDYIVYAYGNTFVNTFSIYLNTNVTFTLKTTVNTPENINKILHFYSYWPFPSYFYSFSASFSTNPGAYVLLEINTINNILTDTWTFAQKNVKWADAQCHY